DIWPPEQAHCPALQAAPVGHLFPQAPQFRGSFPLTFTHAPPEHCVVPVAQLIEQALLLQTWVPMHVVVQLPQWLLSDVTQAPLQLSSPDWHTHAPAVHV